MSTTGAALGYRDNTSDDPTVRARLVVGDNDFHSVTEKVCGIVEQRKTPMAWWVLFAFSSSLTLVLFAMIGYLITTGVGVWGLQVPVSWGYAIVNFVFWVGIGHAGTLISAILFLLRQKLRTSINRFAEAMTIFAVMAAGIFPAIHVGRIWVIYWVFPLPNQMVNQPSTAFDQGPRLAAPAEAVPVQGSVLVDDLHKLTMTDSGALAYKMRSVNFNDLVESAVDALRKKVDDYVIKPFNINQLYKLIEAKVSQTRE